MYRSDITQTVYNTAHNTHISMWSVTQLNALYIVLKRKAIQGLGARSNHALIIGAVFDV